MKNEFEKALAQWGQRASVTHDGNTAETAAFVQPIKRDSTTSQYDMTELGETDKRLWRWLGKADVDIVRGDEVTCGDMTFYVLHAEKEYLGSKAQYMRALLRTVSED